MEDPDERFRAIPPLDQVMMWVPSDFPPLERIERIHDLVEAATELLREDVAEARQQGATWAQIGCALGVKRQTAHQRFGR